MYDLIYGGNEYKDELTKLFPSAKIEDASDEIHEGRISIDVDLDEEEYLRLVVLNGFLDLSLHATIFFMDTENKDIVEELAKKWRKEYPEYFKGE